MRWVTERQLPYDFTYMWNLKINEQHRNRLIDRENKLVVARREGVVVGGDKIGEGD